MMSASACAIFSGIAVMVEFLVPEEGAMLPNDESTPMLTEQPCLKRGAHAANSRLTTQGGAMGRISSWDWEPGQKTVVESLSPLEGHGWQEEPYVSPDGETLAAIVQVGEGEFSIRTNDKVWEATFEKIWYPKFSPDGRLTALCQQDMEWALAIDGEMVGEATDYVWDTMFSKDGSKVVTMYKAMEEYGMAVDGEPWENLYGNANQPAFSSDGAHAAAVVQVVQLAQADIEGFKKGVYTVAIDGTPWEGKYLNVWTPIFDEKGEHVAAQVRTGVHDYTIAVNDKPWAEKFQFVWEPVFKPGTDSAAAPVRVAGKWGVALDGKLIWQPRYAQCLELQYSETEPSCGPSLPLVTASLLRLVTTLHGIRPIPP